ncbi:DUF2812 domain-containing protein [Cytobacillus spongiae]|uniref:DUF2812 domain-containing protein n=1 Tax=Cytobacillus spongiae TaxID=2901381 RepID=UPI001F269941|nr:DUF2812 domain-containing protein [Cytobacillus spongiae]UII54242.1 DUF2812 domain-containing protein [Cytobacillus spongiae]
MGKMVWKLRPSDYWRIGEHESWFSDLAAKGLHLNKMGVLFVKFEKAEPKQMRYRIDISMNKKLTEDQIIMYKDNGWGLVTSYSYFHVFSSPVECNANELHTDPAEQSFTMQELDRKLTSNTLIVLLAMIAIIAMNGSLLFLEGTPIMQLVKNGALQQTMLTLFLLYTSFNTFQASRSIRSLRKNLWEGKPINHQARFKRRSHVHSILSIILVIIIGFSAAIPFTQIFIHDTKTLPIKNSSLKVVRLTDIENNPNLVRESPTYVRDGVDWGNRYTINWSPLAPSQYETDESGLVPGEMWNDKSGEYTPSISTEVFQLIHKGLADPLVNDLAKWYAFDENGEYFEEKDHSKLDRLMVYEMDETKKIIASKEKKVYYVYYFGNSGLDTVIEQTVIKINQ